MISEVVMPQMGADMTEGTLLRWVKSEGEEVKRGEVIAEIETDKANVEIEAFESGVFRRTLASEGDVVRVGDVIAIIAGTDEDISTYAGAPASTPAATVASAPAPVAEAAARSAQPPSQRQSDAKEESQSTAAPEAPAPRPMQKPASATVPQQAPPAPSNGRVRASPLARRLAEERGLDLARLTGSGPGGRITRKDVEAAASTAPAATAAPAAPANGVTRPQEARVVVPSKMRQAIARRMSQSKREAPHYYLTLDIDMTETAAFRKQVNAAVDEAQRVSVNDLIVRACALALQRHPHFNATIDGDQVREHSEQNICIGIALDEGLIAPAIVGAGAMSLVEIATASKDLVERSRNGRLRADEVTGGTFTISNLGAYGVETLIAIIQPPQTAILGVGAAAPAPVARDGAVVIRDVMKVALSADHRVTDGAQGALFLAEIKRLLESPLLLVL